MNNSDIKQRAHDLLSAIERFMASEDFNGDRSVVLYTDYGTLTVNDEDALTTVTWNGWPASHISKL